ncbi:uncharacterized protein IWZ02DRAFT_369582 [Phyllosticta citriasiana]|uniref:uncharacterized protein n=1 Tax=Phyllosticta citriasiana TaxID=595635 RepID=UPI0030FD86A7
MRRSALPRLQTLKTCTHGRQLHHDESHRPLTTNRHLSIFITGGSRGIGLAIARQFARHPNVNTCIIGRDETSLRSAAQSIADLHATPANAHPPSPARERASSYIVGDVTSREFWQSLARGTLSVTETSGKSAPADPAAWDVLVNAAGVSKTAIFVRQSADAIDHVFQTNLMGTTWACKYMIPGMMKRLRLLREDVELDHHPGASIVNVSSLLGVKGGVGSAAYAASKAGVLGLTRALAAEYGPLGLRVNALVPGYVETAMTDAMETKAHDAARDSIPLKRFATADEIASAAVFLVTNRYANNCVLNLDGGLSAM